MKLCECGCGEPAPIAKHTNNKKKIKKGDTLRFVLGHNSTRPEPKRFCLTCGTRIHRTRFQNSRIEDMKIFINRNFCSQKCYGIYNSGSRNWNWKGGKRIDKNGYIYILMGIGHHLSDPSGYALEHRVVAEQMMGRRLQSTEVVHHKI